MAPRTSSIKFEFSGDSSDAVRAFRQIALAAKASGGDLAKYGAQLDAAIKKGSSPASTAASAQLLRDNAIDRIATVASGLPVAGQAVDAFSEQIGGLSTKALVAGAGVTALVGGAIAAGRTFINTAEQVDAVGDAFGSTAREASSVVGILRGVGLNAQQAAPSLAIFAKNVAKNEDELQKLGILVARNSDGGVDYERSLLRVAAAYQATDDPAQQAAVASAAFGRGWIEMVDLLETSLPRLKALQGQGPGISDKDLETLKQFKISLNETKGIGSEFLNTFGGPALGLFNTQLHVLNATAKGTASVFRGEFGAAWDAINGKTERATPIVANAVTSLLDLTFASVAAGEANKNLAATVELASTRAAGAAAAWAALNDTQNTSVGAQVRYKDALAGINQAQTAGAQNARRYQDAQDAVADAAGAQSRAVADGARRIADAEAQAARQIADAQEAVRDAREDAARAAEDAADRVLDAERALTDALTAGAGDDNPLDQQRRREEAQLALDRARRDQQRATADSAEQVADAEKDLNEAQIDGAKSVADARREAAEAQVQAAERVADAQQRANESLDVGTVSIGNQTQKAQELVDATFDAAFQTAAMGGSQEDVKRKVDDAKLALEQNATQLGLTAEQVAFYKAQLDRIPAVVATEVRVKWTASPIQNATNVARTGLMAAIGTTIPQFDGGGIFRTAAPGGAGLAVLHDGEKVSTPGQQAEAGPPVINIHVAGSVWSEGELAGVIERAVRKGYGGEALRSALRRR